MNQFKVIITHNISMLYIGIKYNSKIMIIAFIHFHMSTLLFQIVQKMHLQQKFNKHIN